MEPHFPLPLVRAIDREFPATLCCLGRMHTGNPFHGLSAARCHRVCVCVCGTGWVCVLAVNVPNANVGMSSSMQQRTKTKWMKKEKKIKRKWRSRHGCLRRLR